MLVTREDIVYNVAWVGKITIPKGTPVTRATNLPYEAYWVEPWDNMSHEAESWLRNYGFMVMESEVEEI